MELNFDKQIIWYQTRTYWRKQIAPFDLAQITSVWVSANDIALALFVHMDAHGKTSQISCFASAGVGMQD